MRVPLLAANWKMNKTIGESLSFAASFSAEMTGFDSDLVEIVICPPFTAIPALAAAMAGQMCSVGGQDVFWRESGAFTGEVSPPMLKDAGCSYVIVGHSERRHILGETDDAVRAKLRAALDAGLRPILCVGETLDQRESGDTLKVSEDMVASALSGVAAEEIPYVVIAYEPVWAIGTGKVAGPEEARTVISHIRAVVDRVYGPGYGDKIRVLYGGSVKPGNLRSFVAFPEIDGALVGGASLDSSSFAALARELAKARSKR